MTVPEEEISVSELRSNLPDYLARIHLLGESFSIVKHGKVVAVMRPKRGGSGSRNAGASPKLRKDQNSPDHEEAG